MKLVDENEDFYQCIGEALSKNDHYRAISIESLGDVKCNRMGTRGDENNVNEFVSK